MYFLPSISAVVNVRIGEVVSYLPCEVWYISKVDSSSCFPVNGKLMLRNDELNSLLHKPLTINLPSEKPMSEIDDKRTGCPRLSFTSGPATSFNSVTEKLTSFNTTGLISLSAVNVSSTGDPSALLTPMYNFFDTGLTAISVMVIFSLVVPKAAAIFTSMFFTSKGLAAIFLVSLVSSAKTSAFCESPINNTPVGPNVSAVIDLISGVPVVKP